MNSKKLSLRLVYISILGLLMASVASGCVTAAVAGAGTVAGIEYTNRGAKGSLKGSVDTVAQHAATVFQENGIRTTETKVESGGIERVLGGSQGDLNVEITMKATGDNITQVEVIAQKNVVQWNKDYAKMILEKIAKQG